jgi:phosphorylcholine metabolism protein LicD
MKAFWFGIFLCLVVIIWDGLSRKWLLPGKHCENFSISKTPFRETAISKQDHKMLYSLMERTNLLFVDGGIEYFMIAGSLLGAVRYRGRMPWDDDIDVGMPEEDIKRFETLPFSKYGLGIKNVTFGYKIYDLKNNRKLGDEKVFPFIDVFTFRKKPGGYEYTSKWARKLWPREYLTENELYPLSTCIYGGMVIPCPNKPIQFLDRVFPNWDKFAYISGSHTGGKLYRKYTMDINEKTTNQVLEYLNTL